MTTTFHRVHVLAVSPELRWGPVYGTLASDDQARYSTPVTRNAVMDRVTNGNIAARWNTLMPAAAGRAGGWICHQTLDRFGAGSRRGCSRRNGSHSHSPLNGVENPRRTPAIAGHRIPVTGLCGSHLMWLVRTMVAPTSFDGRAEVQASWAVVATDPDNGSCVAIDEPNRSRDGTFRAGRNGQPAINSRGYSSTVEPAMVSRDSGSTPPPAHFYGLMPTLAVVVELYRV